LRLSLKIRIFDRFSFNDKKLWHNKLLINIIFSLKIIVKVIKEKLENSLEAKASDNRFPAYIFESKGEILELNDEYALVKFYTPTPSTWFRLDHLEVVN
jgi:Cyanobacterial and plant NDH-1 subunit O